MALPSVSTNLNGTLGCALLCFFIVPGILYIMYAWGDFPVCARCGQRDSLVPLSTPKGMEVLDLAKSRSEALPRRDRPCPFCAEQILAQAVVCKHCKRDVTPLVTKV